MAWLRDEQAELAAEAILDAAGELFLRQGVNRTGMTEIARAAGCSRATLYRYFPTREELRLAYVAREARRVADAVARSTAAVADPDERLTASILEALARVRATPTLAAWFSADDAGVAHRLALSAEVIDTVARALVGTDVDLEARWIVRVIVSLLAAPCDDPVEEHALVRRFVVGPLSGAVAR